MIRRLRPLRCPNFARSTRPLAAALAISATLGATSAHAAEPGAAAPVEAVDQPLDRRGLAVGGSIFSLGIAAGVAAGIVTNVALTPSCADPSDMMTCNVPDRADVRRRIGLLGTAPALSITGAVMAGLGTRRLMQSLPETSTTGQRRRRRAVIAAGTVSLVAGAAAAVVGPTLTGLGAKRVVARPDVDVEAASSIDEGQEMVAADARDRLAGLRTARSGLAVAMVAPTLITVGIALLRNRPAGPRPARVAPQLGPHFAGVTLSGRF